jgi:energy-converting hydrogenase A subunit M
MNLVKHDRTISADELVVFLNQLINIDRDAMTKLILNCKVPCSRQLALHPTLQIAKENYDKKLYSLGILGFLNGLFSTNEVPVIEAVFNKDMQLIRFQRHR